MSLREAASIDREPGIVTVGFLLRTDLNLERLWARSASLGDRLVKAGGIDVVVAPGYSTWSTDSPFAILHSMARTAEHARLLARRLPTVPTVVWRYQKDLDRWATWLRETRAPAICADLATLRKADEWRWGLNCLAHLAATLGTDAVPRLLALGPSRLTRIRDVRVAWPGPLTVASQHPARLARGGKLLLPDLVSEPADPATTLEELLDRNIATFSETVGAICNPPATLDEARKAI